MMMFAIQRRISVAYEGDSGNILCDTRCIISCKAGNNANGSISGVLASMASYFSSS